MAQAKIQYYMDQLDKELHKSNAFTDALEKIEKKTNVKRVHLVSGVIVVCIFYLMFGYGAQFLCQFLGFVYPAYASVKAVESKEKDDDTKWLTYWVVYASFSLVEFFADIFLFWIPFYWLLKCIFMVYLMAPGDYNGSMVVYNRVIKPLFLKHEAAIDAQLNRAASTANKAYGDAKNAAAHAAADYSTQHTD